MRTWTYITYFHLCHTKHCSTWYWVIVCCSVAKLCPTLCDPMDCSTPGFPVLHYLPEFIHTHVRWVCDAIQPSHPLWPPSLLALNLSQHHGLFQWVSSSHQVTKVLEFQLQHQSFQWIFRIDFLQDWLVWSPCSLWGSQKSSPAPQLESIISSACSLLYDPTLISVHTYQKEVKRRLCLPMQGIPVLPLVWELRSHVPWDQKKNPKLRTEAVLQQIQ